MFELLYVQYSKVGKCIKSSEKYPIDLKNKNFNMIKKKSLYSIEKYKYFKVTEYYRVY